MTTSLRQSTKKTLTAGLAALTLGGALLATAAPAQAGHWRHRHHGGAVAAGVVGGLALGAIIASQGRAYAEPVYLEPECYTVKKRFVNAYGDTYVRRVRVCE